MSYSGKFKDKNNNLHPVTSVLYGTCDTAAATAAKVVTCTDFDTLMTGVTIRVKFANANTAASPTVNINSTGAKSVYRFGSTAPVDGNSWNAGEVVELVYDGTSFFMTGADDISVKQNVNDNSLETTDKTIVGAINEHEGDIDSLKSGLTNLDNEVNGDATVYPYADVITINDAVPANLADCSVKVEPVQDLHGYDHPWVGGAGDNKFSGSDNTYTRSDQSATKWLFANVPLSSEFTGAYYISFDYLLSEVGDTGEVLFYGYSNGTQITGNICKMDDKTTSTQWKHFSGLMTKSVTFDAIGCYTDDLISIKNIMVSATDATFAPYTNICPISGHTEAVVTREGKNLCQPKNYVSDDYDGTTYTDVDGDGVITEDITLGAGTYKFSIKLLSLPNADRSITFNTSKYSGSIWGVGNLDTKEVGKLYSYTVTLESETTFRGYLYGIGGGTFKIQMQIERGDTATDYEPFHGKTYTIALGDTIYGGTVDFDSGVMTVDKVLVSINSTTQITANNATQYYVNQSTASGFEQGKNVISDKFESIASSTGGGCFINSAGLIRFNTDTEYSSVSDLIADLTSIQFVAKLATPTTIQLTPEQIQLLQGTNTLYASTGDISVTVNGVSGAIGSVQEQVNDHEERIEAVESGLTNLANDTTTIQTLIALDKTTIVSGGYVQIGKAVIVTVSVTLTGNAGAVNAEISGFPITINDVIIHVRDGSDYTKVTTARISNGVLYFDTAMTAGDYVLSGTYILIN